MALLILFALLAGAGTAVSPCALPILPVILAAGAGGGRRRPLGIAIGLATTFSIATVAVVYLLDALGLPNDFMRTLAIVALSIFGLVLLIRPLADRVEARLSRIGLAPRGLSGQGFGGGFVLGASLGFAYFPCAGPILAGVLTISAAQPLSLDRLLVALAYSVGTAAALFVLLLGGRRLLAHVRRGQALIQPLAGALMLALALAMVTNLDTRYERFLAQHAPSVLINPARGIEESHAAQQRLAELRGRRAQQAGVAEANSGARLPVLGSAPEFADTGRWFNTPGSRPLTMAGLRGRVVLIDFWTYTCINCIRTLPHLEALDAKYRGDGLTVIGVHSPEFPFERDASNVASAIAGDRIRYPVVQDNQLATWNAWSNAYWPAEYLVDAQGRVRYVHFGEGDYAGGERAVRSLLVEAGSRRLGTMTHPRIELPSKELTTPETYLGAARASGFANGPIQSGAHNYGALPARLQPNALAYGGEWRIGQEAATAGNGAELALDFTARRVYLVLGSPGTTRPLSVSLDGHPVPPQLAGGDVHAGVATVGPQRLYRLIDLPRVERHLLRLRFAPGMSGYAFTFG